MATFVLTDSFVALYYVSYSYQTGGPPQLREAMGNPCLDFWNNLCHIDLMEEWVYYNYWFGAWVIGPIFAIAIFLYDIFTGFFFP